MPAGIPLLPIALRIRFSLTLLGIAFVARLLPGLDRLVPRILPDQVLLGSRSSSSFASARREPQILPARLRQQPSAFAAVGQDPLDQRPKSLVVLMT